MFNIKDRMQIINLEKTGCTKSHIEQCLWDKTKHDDPVYSYLGKTVSKGSVLLHTCNGDFILKFEEKNGWARKLVIK